MKIIVKQAEATTEKLSFQGNSYEVTTQKAVVESDDGEMRAPITLRLKKDAKPHAAGEYSIDDASIVYDGKKKELSLARELILKPLKAGIAQQRIAS